MQEKYIFKIKRRSDTLGISSKLVSVTIPVSNLVDTTIRTCNAWRQALQRAKDLFGTDIKSIELESVEGVKGDEEK